MMKRILAVGLAGLCLGAAARCDEDVCAPIRPGDPEAGVPFWNDYATIFRYAPAFSFTNVAGAVRYRFTVKNAAATKTFEAAKPWAALSPVWKDLPNGTGYSVRCEGLDAAGKAVGTAGERFFTKTAAFGEARIPPAARPYRESARMIYDYMTALPAMRTLLETGKPEQTYQHNAYVAKTHAAHINCMLRWARFDPARREKAMAFAKASADFLLKELEPAGAPLAWWPPTYGRKPLEFDPKKDGDAKREAMNGNEPRAAAKYRGQVMLIYPADVGRAFVNYYRATGERKYLDAALGIAGTFLRVRRADGTWPLKMILATGEPIGRNALVPTAPMALFEALADVTGEAKWRAAADACFAYLENGPVKTMNWDGQFEDIEPKAPYMGLTKHNALDAMFQILKRHPGDAARLHTARELLRYSEDQFVFWEAPCRPDEAIRSPGEGARKEKPSMGGYGKYEYPSVFEQYSCYCSIDASASKLIRAYVAMWQATKDPLDLAKAKALANEITRMQQPSGRVPTFWTNNWVSDVRYDWLNCMGSSAEALLAVADAEAEANAVRAINLEDPAARQRQPKFVQPSYEGRVDEFKGPNGNWSYRFKVTKAWCGELPQWPSLNLVPQVTDWSAYDRLVIDVFNDAVGGDSLSSFIANAEGRVQNGLQPRNLPLPDYGYVRWTIPLRHWPKTCDPKRIGRVHLFMTTPNSANVLVSGFYLLKPGEAAPAPSETFLDETVRPAELKARRLARERREKAVTRFVAKCRAAGQSGRNCWIGKATSMERVRPRNDFDVAAADSFSLKAARGEYESLQVLVMPNGRDLRDVSVEVSDLAGDGATLAAAAFKAAPVGYSQTVNPAPYRIGENVATNLPGGYFRERVKAGLGWWPDPILDYLTAADVKGDDVQSFWVRFRCPDDQRAGLYRGTLKVKGPDWEEAFPLAVRVWNFAVPKKSPLPLAITFGPSPSTQFADADQLELNKRLRADPAAPVNAWRKHATEWGDFLADYYISRDSLYHANGIDWPTLQRLKAQGRLGLFNLGYWHHTLDLSEKGKAAWLREVRARLAKSYQKAKELGLLDHAYIYGCDEIAPQYFENIRWALGELRCEFPGVALSTTAYDHDFGVGSVLSDMDWFTPTTDKYEENFAKVAPSRQAGHQVWWYIACGQQAPRANLFVENQPIEARQLMGAQTVKFRPDGFLYYQVSIWNSLKCIDGKSTFTDWEPRSWTTFHGDGSWFCCGPDGTPCATVRIENFRDGLEDYAYALEYERVTGRKAEVPPEVCRSVWQYTDDPKAYYAWRDALAEAIEGTAPVEPRFSLTYDGKAVDSADVPVERGARDGEWTVETRMVGGLTVVTRSRRFGEAVEWVNWLENRQAEDTKRIVAFRDCDLRVPFAPDPVPGSKAFVTEDVQTLVYSHVGSVWAANEFAAADVGDVCSANRSRQCLFQGGKPMRFACAGGRSCDGTMPFFNVNRGDEGVIFAIGWSGQWTCDLSRDKDGTVRIRTGLEDCDFYLKPGERIRLSSVVVLPYRNGYLAGQNAFRRLVKDRYSIIGATGRPSTGPMSLNLWGGVTSAELARRIDFAARQKLGFEYAWVDAGWYGQFTTPSPNEFEGAWWMDAGDWRPNPNFHPDGMADVAGAAHRNGMKFLLWLEIERALRRSPVAQAHPDWFLWPADTAGERDPGLLDLGNPAAWQWAHETLAGHIRTLGIDCYRQDFNMGPLRNWRKADAKDGRKGLHEVRHIMGLYRLWDALLAEFPNLIIDNCASGGRRIDIELCRRSVPLWRSDYQCPANHDPDVAQNHTRNLSLWLPYHGTSIGRKVGDTYLARSCYTSALGCNFLFSMDNSPEEYSPAELEWIRKFVAEYKRVRPLLSEDYYPLTPFATDKAAWCVMEFYSPAAREGVILAYRRAESPFSAGVFRLQGVDERAMYEFCDADAGEAHVFNGKELLTGGVRIEMPCARSAKVLFFKAKDER